MEKETTNRMTSSHKITLWIIIILLVAIAVRLVGLNQMPFTEADAILSADALAISKNSQIGSSSIPAYTGVTGVLFFLFGPSNPLARSLPVFAGISLVLAGFLFIKENNHTAALIFAIALSLDPYMVTMSRQLDSPFYALAGLVWAYWFVKERKFILSGILLAFAFLGGLYFWIFGMAIAILLVLGRFLKINLLVLNNTLKMNKKEWIGIIGAFLITCGLLSTGFLLKVDGFGQIGAGFLSFLRLILQPYKLPFYHVLPSIIGFAFLPLLGTIFWLTGKNTKTTPQRRVFLIWMLVIGIMLTILFSRDQMGSFVLILVPMWYMFASWISEMRFISEIKSFQLVLFLLFSLMIIYVSMTSVGLFTNTATNGVSWQFGIAIFSGLLLIAVLFWIGTMLLGTEKTGSVFLYSLLLILSVVMVSKTFNSLKKTSMETQLSFNYGPLVLANVNQLQATDWFETYGKVNSMEATIKPMDIGLDLRWQFRNLKLDQGSQLPEFILSKNETLPTNEIPYRGMRVELSRTIPWDKMGISEYFSAFFQPTKTWNIENAYFWAQTNLFTGANE